jgi:cytochrome oxidase Cu insertion factor (SCO1/SenC/PrrC family)
MHISARLIAVIGLSVAFLPIAIGHAEGDSEMITVGESFVGFELEAHDGTTVSSVALEGRPFLLFFYPKASTPG